MYVVTGATGRVGSVVAQTLLDAGAEVRVIVRRAEDAAVWARRGARTHIATLTDRRALAAGFRDVAGVFVLLPFDLTVPDLGAHADGLVASIAGAVVDSAVPHVVMLSSGGADLAEGTGPIVGLHRLERALGRTGVVVTALRSGHFQEKVGDVLAAAMAERIYPAFATSADVAVPMVATQDLGEVAAHLLLAPPARSEAVDIVGPAYSERDVANVLGTALGRALTVETVPAEAWAGALQVAGFAPHVAQSLAELYRADEAGLLAPRGDRVVQVSTPLEATIGRMLAVLS